MPGLSGLCIRVYVEGYPEQTLQMNKLNGKGGREAKEVEGLKRKKKAIDLHGCDNAGLLV